MLRTSAAAGVGAVFLPPGAADAFAPKVVRAGMGAHFRLPIHSLDWDAIREQVATRGLRVYLADARAGVVCFQADFRSPCALLIGGEAGGASEAGQALAQQSVHIPMPGGSESLNAAAAAAVLLFEVVRQRSG
jgi:TrmH family RNA methyltransferase